MAVGEQTVLWTRIKIVITRDHAQARRQMNTLRTTDERTDGILNLVTHPSRCCAIVVCAPLEVHVLVALKKMKKIVGDRRKALMSMKPPVGMVG